jgi:hypothetical protein
MRRSIEDHNVQPWRVHAFAADFELLDVWRFPVQLRADIPLLTFLDFQSEMQSELVGGRGMAARLFRLRRWLGQLFGWDRDEEPVHERLGKGDPGGRSLGGFRPVYSEEEEALFEIENATVHALMHFGRVFVDDRDSPTAWAPQMSVYVKPRGVLGRVYMTAIGPFRHLIVYPAMMRAAERAWPQYASRMGLA